MAMRPVKAEPVAIAILAKAPIPGMAKTRLIPALGAHGAAMMQEQLTIRAVKTAVASAIGPVFLWTTPDTTHPLFRELAARFPIEITAQPEGDLGLRMLAAIEAANGPVIVIGTDCPALSPESLREAARVLRGGSAVVVIPAEDGGYVMIGMREMQPALFADIDWGTDKVMATTRRRAEQSGVAIREFPPLWDVDRPEDLERLREDEALRVFL